MLINKKKFRKVKKYVMWKKLLNPTKSTICDKGCCPEFKMLPIFKTHFFILRSKTYPI